MKRLIGIAGGIASLFAIIILLTDHFGDGMSQLDVTRIGVVAIAGAILLHGVRRFGGSPWKQHGFAPGELADVAKHAIDADAKRKGGDA